MYVFILLELNKLSKKSWAIVRLAPNSNVCRNINPSINLFSDLVITLGLSEARALGQLRNLQRANRLFLHMYFWLYPQRCIWKYKWPSGSDINWSYGSTPILLYKVKVMSDCSGVRIIMHSLPTSGQRVYWLAKGYIKETPWPKQQSFSSSTSMSEGECGKYLDLGLTDVWGCEFDRTHKKYLDSI